MTTDNVQTQMLQMDGLLEQLREARPGSKEDLRNYVKVFLGIDIPDKIFCEGHTSPMDYLWHCFSTDFAPAEQARPNGDAVIWANRGGGKTEIAAIATLMDCVFKPGCQVRILGGSLEQSSRMYNYMAEFVRRGFEKFLAGPVRKEKCLFANGSSVEILPQSSKSIRGTHIHKLRCDEIELFDEQVFAAAQFITQSTKGITAAMEVISTMHRPYGLMKRVVEQAEKNKTPIFKWCVWEVIEQCEGRSCSQCRLWSDCGGKAKQASGYLKIDDCVTQMLRSSRASFESEMLCKRPLIENVVFNDFKIDVHVAEVGYDPNMPLYRAIDFGFVNPFVCMWIQVDGKGCVRVIDEYTRSRAAIAVHGENIKGRFNCREESIAATFCDPAGVGRNDVTGTSAVRELRAMGIRTKYRKSSILEGIELVRRALRAGDGSSKLIIAPKCVRLIEAMQCYHYPDSGSVESGSEMPVKDGVYDHHIDALRYFFVNYLKKTKTTMRRY